MRAETRTALKWGFLIGLVNLAWLYLDYFFGMHTNGLEIFQLFVLGWFILTLAGFILALRSIRRVSSSWSYWKGLPAGIVAAAASAAVAVLMQIGYYTVIHPQWPDYMAEETRRHFLRLGMPEEQVQNMVGQARRTFTLRNYATQSALTALITGTFLSAIIMIFLRRPAATAVPSPRPVLHPSPGESPGS